MNPSPLSLPDTLAGSSAANLTSNAVTVPATTVEAETMTTTGAYYKTGTQTLLWGDGKLTTQLSSLASGIYQIEVVTFGIPDGSNQPKMRVMADNRLAADPVSVSNNNWQYQSQLFDNIELSGTGHSFSIDLFQPLGSVSLWIDKIILRRTGDVLPATQRAVLEAEQMTPQGGTYASPSSVLLWSNGSLSGQTSGLDAGVYEMEVVAFGLDGDGDQARMRVTANNRMAGDAVAVKNNGWNYQGYVFSGVELGTGTNNFKVDFFNDSPARDLWIDKIILRKTGTLPYLGLRPAAEAETMQASGGNYTAATATRIWQNGLLQTQLTNLASGHYTLDLDALGVDQNGLSSKIEVRVDGALAGPAFSVANNDWNYKRYRAGELDLTGGNHTVTIKFADDSVARDVWIDRLQLRKTAELPAPQNTRVFSLSLNSTILTAAATFGSAGTTAQGESGGWAIEISKLFLSGIADVFDNIIFLPTLQAARNLSLADITSPNDNGIGTFYGGLRNSVTGIGRDTADYGSYFGSMDGGALQGILYIDSGVKNDSDFRFSSSDFTQLRNQVLWENVLSQEMGHRFGSFLTADAGNPFGLLGRADSHWNPFFDADFSPMDGNDWVDNGNGSFTLTHSYIDEIKQLRTTTPMPYNDLDLYAMGLLDASEVRAGFVIQNPRDSFGRRIRPYAQVGETPPSGGPYIQVELSPGIWSTSRTLYNGDVVTGTKRTVTLADVINLEGRRSPAFPNTVKNFNPAFVVITDPSDTAATVQSFTEKVRGFQNSFASFFSGITRGLGTIQLPSASLSYARSNLLQSAAASASGISNVLNAAADSLVTPSAPTFFSHSVRPTHDFYWDALVRGNHASIFTERRKKKSRLVNLPSLAVSHF